MNIPELSSYDSLISYLSFGSCSASLFAREVAASYRCSEHRSSQMLAGTRSIVVSAPCFCSGGTEGLGIDSYLVLTLLRCS